MTHTVIEMKSSVEELHSRLDTAEEKIANGSEENAQEAAQRVKVMGSLREKLRLCCIERKGAWYT